MFNKIASFTLNSEEKSNIYTNVFVSQPNSVKEGLAGKLFILTELEGKNSEIIKFTEFLITTLEDLYYNDEKISIREKLNNLRVENIFETVLSKLNEKLYNFIQEEDLIDKIEKFNIIIGVSYNDEIHFAQIGNNKAFVLFKKNDTYDFLPIGEESDNEKIKYSEMFDSLVSGQIPPGSFFITANEALAEYITTETLKEVITILPPISAAEQIKNNLQQINGRVPFSGIIIKNTFGQIDTEISRQNSTTTNLNYAEEKTSNILSNSVSLNIAKVGKSIKNSIYKLKRKENKKDNEEISKPNGYQNIDKENVEYEKNLQNEKKIINPIENKEEKKHLSAKDIGLKDKIFVGKKPSPFNIIKKATPLAYLFNKDNWRGKKFKLNRSGKIILISILLIIFIFSANLMVSRQKAKKQAILEAYNNKISQIEQKQNQIDSYLLYKNEDSAKSLLKENEELINSLPREQEQQEKTYQEYINKYQEQIDKVKKVVENNTEEVISLAKDSDIEEISLINDKLYALDKNGSVIYTINPDEKNLDTKKIEEDIDIKNIKKASIKDDNIYYLSNNKLLNFDTKNKELSVINYSLPENINNFSDSETWSSYIYLLDGDNNQLYQYEKSNNSLSFYKNWLDDSSISNNPIDIAIDGNIYFLYSNGNVERFYGSNKEKFEIDLVEPEISSAEKIIIIDKNLYILESAKNRIIKFELDNNGEKRPTKANFIAQFKINVEQETIKDVVIKNNSTSYILTSNKIYKLNLNNN
ncbi:hypothetical protein EOL94_02175 [bacterium]|nr:hypothetical protein [bacterium]